MRRVENSTSSGSRYPNTGMTGFVIRGYVQSVTQNHKMKCDYLRFCINQNDNDYYDVVSATLPHNLGIAVDVGDHLELDGYIRSWSRDGRVTLELVIENIDEVNDGAEELMA